MCKDSSNAPERPQTRVCKDCLPPLAALVALSRRGGAVMAKTTFPSARGHWDDIPTSGGGWQSHELSDSKWKVETILLRHYSHL